MRATAPLDVDLEDKLLYGLTPMRLAYLIIGLVAGLGVWSSPWAPSPVRGLACSTVIATGAIAAWGRWRGRAVDAWAVDLLLFVVSTHRVAVDGHWFRRFRTSIAVAAPVEPRTQPVTIVVTGRAPRVGATTVAIELAAALAVKGYSPELWLVRDAFMGHFGKPSATEPLLSVASGEAGRECYLDCGAGSSVVGVIPEDDLVRRAASLNQATVVAFPEAAASKAFANLVDVIAAAT